MTAEYDVFRDSGEAYAHRLTDAGVAATLRRHLGHVHGSASLVGWGPAEEWRDGSSTFCGHRSVPSRRRRRDRGGGLAMVRILLRRLALSLPLLFVVSALTFVLVSLVPGDPASSIAGSTASTAQVAQLRRQLGLDQPVYAQYWHWLQGALRGDLGHSLLNGEAVTSLLDGRLVVSLTLIVGAVLVLIVTGVGLGVASALRGGRLGRAIDAFAGLAMAVPSFWLGLLLIELLAVRIRLFPATGWVPFSDSPGGWLRSLALPVLTLALGNLALIAQQTRDSVADALGRDFVRVYQANGIARWSIVYRHALRNASIPIVTVLGIVFVAQLGATIFVETVFALPGLGFLASQATLSHDLPVIQGVALYFTVIVIAVNLVIDLLHVALDPRVRIA